jgi:Spy/CpxP family protein refolding chaperone
MQTSRSISVFIAVIASGFTLLNVVSAAHAGQEASPKTGAPKPGAGKRMGGGMADPLNLTPAQTATLKTMQSDMIKKMTAIRGNKSLTPQQQNTQMQALATSSMKKMTAILTPEQKKKMQKMMAEQRVRMQAGKGAAPVAPK